MLGDKRATILADALYEIKEARVEELPTPSGWNKITWRLVLLARLPSTSKRELVICFIRRTQQRKFALLSVVCS